MKDDFIKNIKRLKRLKEIKDYVNKMKGSINKEYLEDATEICSSLINKFGDVKSIIIKQISSCECPPEFDDDEGPCEHRKYPTEIYDIVDEVINDFEKENPSTSGEFTFTKKDMFAAFKHGIDYNKTYDNLDMDSGDMSEETPIDELPFAEWLQYYKGTMD